MKVLYFHQYFATREGASATRSFELARRLVAAGHQVTVVTADTTRLRDGAGRLAPGHLVARRTVEGIDLVVINVPYSNYLPYAARLASFAAFTVAAGLAGLGASRPDVVFATSTPLTVGIPGLLVARARRRPFVFELRDLWPEVPIAMGALRHPATVAAARRLERTLYDAAARIVVLSEGSREALQADGVADEKIVFIPNASDLDLFRPDNVDEGFRSEHGLQDRFVALYAGAVGRANGLDCVVDAAAELARLGDERVAVVVIGDGSERPRLETRARELGLTNILFLPPVPKERLAGVVGAVDATLTLFADDPVFATNSPNKFFDGLAAAKPAIVNVDGWLRRLAEDERAGLYVPAGDPSALAAAMAALAAEPEAARAMGLNARRLAEREFDREAMAGRLLETLEEVASRTDTAAASPRTQSGRAGGRSDETDARPGAADGRIELPRGFRFPDSAPEIADSAALEAAAVHSFYGRRGKRLLDLAVAVPATALVAPLIAGLAAVVYASSGRPVLFTQERVGRDGEPFLIHKFRTMIPDAVRHGSGYYLDEGDARITRAGRWMRAFGLDELPQLFNVLKGDMSLVGPRPNLAFVVDQYREHYERILRVKPGITGLVAIRGRNTLRRSEMWRWDEYYVATLSFRNDVKIMLETIPTALLRRGASDAVSREFIEDPLCAPDETERPEPTV